MNKAAEEMLQGIYEGLGDREPSPALQSKIDELREQIEDDSWHGWECYCNRCCE